MLEDANQPPTKKKSSWKWIIAACMGLLAIVIAIVGSSYSINSQKEAKNNDIRVAKAKEIAEDSDLFEIDKYRLGSDMYIEYVYEFRPNNSTDTSEREGIYIGALVKGIPQGYGVFYYEWESNKDGRKSHGDIMLLGEWEKGNLKEGATVEIRDSEHIEDAEDAIWEYKCTFNDTWGDGWFIHDEEEGNW